MNDIIERLQELLDNRLDQKIYYKDDFETFEAAIARIKQLESESNIWFHKFQKLMTYFVVIMKSTQPEYEISLDLFRRMSKGDEVIFYQPHDKDVVVVKLKEGKHV